MRYNIRKFSDREIETLRVIECLKKSGLEIKQIKQFMQWCKEGSSTYPQRKALFEEQKKQVEEEIEKLNKTLDMLKFKCWYYSVAIKSGNGKTSRYCPRPICPRKLKRHISTHTVD